MTSSYRIAIIEERAKGVELYGFDTEKEAKERADYVNLYLKFNQKMKPRLRAVVVKEGT